MTLTSVSHLRTATIFRYVASNKWGSPYTVVHKRLLSQYLKLTFLSMQATLFCKYMRQLGVDKD